MFCDDRIITKFITVLDAENFILSFSLTIIIKFLRILRILKIFQKNITVHVVYQIQA